MKFRFTMSGARVASRSAIGVKISLRRRLTPSMPSSHIRRATWSRPISWPPGRTASKLVGPADLAVGDPQDHQRLHHHGVTHDPSRSKTRHLAVSMCSEPPATPCSWARLQTCHDARRRNRRSLRWAVELRLGEIRRRLAQDLVRPAQLAVLLLERLHPSRVLARPDRLYPLLDIGALDLLAHRLHPYPSRSAVRCTVPCSRPAPEALAYQPHRLCLLLIAVPPRGRPSCNSLLWHGSILVPRSGASNDPRRFKPSRTPAQTPRSWWGGSWARSMASALRRSRAAVWSRSWAMM